WATLTICDHLQGQRFRLTLGFFLGRSIAHHARQVRNLRNPAAVFFTLEFEPEIHALSLARFCADDTPAFTCPTPSTSYPACGTGSPRRCAWLRGVRRLPGR